MRALLGMLAFLSCAGCIFTDGFDKGCPVIIGSGNYGYTGAQIVASNGSLSFLSTTAELFDGQPSTRTRLPWSDDPQSTSTFTAIEWSMTPSPDSITVLPVTYGVVAVLNTTLPVGMKVELRKGSTVGDVIATGTMKSDGNGATCVWFIVDNQSTDGNPLLFMAYNDVNGSHPMTQAQEWEVGEIFVGLRSDWDIKRNPKIGSATTPKQNLSSDGTQFSVFNPRVRQSHFELSAVDQKTAMNADDGDIDFEALINSMYASDICAFIPFETPDPALYGEVDLDDASAYRIRARTAYVGNVQQAATTTGDGDKFYECTLDVQESI